MANITRYPLYRHLRAAANRHVLHWSKGRLRRSGRGLSFWFRPLTTSLAEVPCDDHELPFLFHARTLDFQDVSVQGVISWRVRDPELVAERIDFSIDPGKGLWTETPLQQLADIVTSRALELSSGYLVAHSLREILTDGVETVRERVLSGLVGDAAFDDMGLQIVAVAITDISPTTELEQALQTPTLEALQQRADEATFERRALAVEKERAIQENELSTKVKLAERETELIARRGENERRRATELAEAERIGAESRAQRVRLESASEADTIRLLDEAKLDGERERQELSVSAERELMLAYGSAAPHVLLGLAAREFAGKLQNIEQIQVTPDQLGDLLSRLIRFSGRSLAEPSTSIAGSADADDDEA